MNNTITSTNIVSEVEKAFKTLYGILEQENADPSESCYQIHSVEFDILEILRGNLKPHTNVEEVAS
jgi:hypothetical protein